jgi:hypothetical protein
MSGISYNSGLFFRIPACFRRRAEKLNSKKRRSDEFAQILSKNRSVNHNGIGFFYFVSGPLIGSGAEGKKI